jgi:hypothetical protein
MAKENKSQSQIIEHGDLFFFYGPKIDSSEVNELGDVQRFYMVTSPEKEKATTKNVYRLFMLGQKQLPDVEKSNRDIL